MSHLVGMKGVIERLYSQPCFAVLETLRRAPGWGLAGTLRNWLLFGKVDPSPGWPRNVPLLSGGLRPTERPGSCWKPLAQE